MATILLRDYDLEAARARFSARVDRARGLVFDARGQIKFFFVQCVRELGDWSSLHTSVLSLGYTIRGALEILPVAYGGTVAPVEGGHAALPENLTPDLPLVRAWMVLRGHPRHPPFRNVMLRRPEQPPAYPKRDIAPMLEAFYAADPPVWDLARFERLVLEGAARYMGDVEIESTWHPDQIYPGSKVGEYMFILAKAFLYDAFGAFDPAFTRQDALVGEWWLLQPVSPRLSHHHLGLKFGLQLAGYLRPSHVDVAGRVIMACYPREAMRDDHRARLLDDSKFVAGWQKVQWTKSRPPLTEPGFDLVQLEGVTEDSYGPYRHSSELPPWPPPGVTGTSHLA